MKKPSGDVIILILYSKKNTIIWCMLTQIRSACTDIIFGHFRPFFAFLPNYWLQQLKFGKNCKKTPGHIIILHMCIINQDYMMYGSWDMKFNRHNFLVILGNILPFYSLIPWKMKTSKMKNEYILFQRYGTWQL